MLRVRPDEGDTGEIAGGVRPAGQLRVYLAAAAGAGKTIAMLDEGLRRREQGADVVIAFTEDHGRPATRARAGIDVHIVAMGEGTAVVRSADG